jgi:hypothetical protein
MVNQKISPQEKIKLRDIFEKDPKFLKLISELKEILAGHDSFLYFQDTSYRVEEIGSMMEDININEYDLSEEYRKVYDDAWSLMDHIEDEMPSYKDF